MERFTSSAFGEREVACAVESEILRAGNALMDFQLIVSALVGIVGARISRNGIGNLNHLFFWSELYRRTKGTVNIIFCLMKIPLLLRCAARANLKRAGYIGLRRSDSIYSKRPEQPPLPLRVHGHDRACEKRAQEKISDLAKIYDVHVHKIQRQLFALNVFSSC